MKGTFNFSVLKEDWENSSKRYLDLYKCPAATALKRQFPNHTWYSTGVDVVSIDESTGFLEKEFTEADFKALRDHGTEFHTTIIFD